MRRRLPGLAAALSWRVEETGRQASGEAARTATTKCDTRMLLMVTKRRSRLAAAVIVASAAAADNDFTHR